MSLDAEFDELNDLENGGGVGKVPEKIREMRRQVVARNGGRLDDVEFTFQGGGVARTLGEATLWNRVKSHPDVGERWYPEILSRIRERQKREKEEADRQAANALPVSEKTALVQNLGQAVEAH